VIGAAGGYFGSRQWKGKIAEIVIFDSALSATDQQKVEGYLGHKYGLHRAMPVSHPYRDVQP
jgi:hypothetical protein